MADVLSVVCLSVATRMNCNKTSVVKTMPFYIRFPGPLSVCMSVMTRVYCDNTDEVKITPFYTRFRSSRWTNSWMCCDVNSWYYPLSVCLCVATWVYYSKTAEIMIMPLYVRFPGPLSAMTRVYCDKTAEVKIIPFYTHSGYRPRLNRECVVTKQLTLPSFACLFVFRNTSNRTAEVHLRICNYTTPIVFGCIWSRFNTGYLYVTLDWSYMLLTKLKEIP